ncbi:MAG: nuclear transport factor 2 family protein [Pyrinomonadaceae bacterium]|nr:nuclear transport factor 2 family protein [Pyrinomonadaceae bacterium]
MKFQYRNEEEQVRRLEEDFIEALRTQDVQSLDNILADDFVFTDPRGTSFSKAQWLASLAAGTLSFDSINIENLNVRVSGDTAIVTGRVTLKARSEEGGYNGQFSVIDIYMKRQERWWAVLSAGEYVQLLSQK